MGDVVEMTASRIRGRNALRWRKAGLTLKQIGDKLGVGAARARVIVAKEHKREWKKRPIAKVWAKVKREIDRADDKKRRERYADWDDAVTQAVIGRLDQDLQSAMPIFDKDALQQQLAWRYGRY